MEETTQVRRQRTSDNGEGDETTDATSSGYHTDVTNSADDAGILVGNECDDFTTNTDSSGAAKSEVVGTDKSASAGECDVLSTPAMMAP